MKNKGKAETGLAGVKTILINVEKARDIRVREHDYIYVVLTFRNKRPQN